MGVVRIDAPWAGSAMDAQSDVQWAAHERRGRVCSRPPVFDRPQYRRRSAVERCGSKWEQFRAVASRYGKRDYMFNGALTVTEIVIWLHGTVEEPSEALSSPYRLARTDTVSPAAQISWTNAVRSSRSASPGL